MRRATSHCVLLLCLWTSGCAILLPAGGALIGSAGGFLAAGTIGAIAGAAVGAGAGAGVSEVVEAVDGVTDPLGTATKNIDFGKTLLLLAGVYILMGFWSKEDEDDGS